MVERRAVVWGASGHARVVADIIHAGRGTVVAFIDETGPPPSTDDSVPQLLRSRDDVLAFFEMGRATELLIAIGDNEARMRVSDWCRTRELPVVKGIHPTAIIAHSATVGIGTIVCAGAILSAGAVVGPDSIVNTAATIDHDCDLARGVHISPGVHVAGHVKIGEGAWIGIGSSVRDRVLIGSWSIIGAGSVVVTDIRNGMLAYGNPACEVRQCREG